MSKIKTPVVGEVLSETHWTLLEDATGRGLGYIFEASDVAPIATALNHHDELVKALAELLLSIDTDHAPSVRQAKADARVLLHKIGDPQ